MNKSPACSGVRSLADFCAVFALTPANMPASILVFPAGISSFGAQMYQAGQSMVVSLDPYYDLSPMDMLKHVNFVIQSLAEHADPETCAAEMNQWQATSDLFLQDYSVGQKEGRYVAMTWNQLASGQAGFELALCPDLFSAAFHAHATEILTGCLALAKEVRVFPIQADNGELFPELAPLMLMLQAANFGVEIKEVHHPAQQKPSALLRVWSTGCVVA